MFQVLFLFLNVKLFGFKWKKKERERKKSKKFFFFKQKKHTYKLPYQLASQGCQIHLAPKETQKKSKLKKKNQNPKFIFITAKVFSSWSLHPGLVWMSVFDFGFDFVKGRGGVGILGFGGLGQEETFSFLFDQWAASWLGKVVGSEALWPSAPHPEAPVSMSLSIVCPRATPVRPYTQG